MSVDPRRRIGGGRGMSEPTAGVVVTRPTPGTPRPYDFPPVERHPPLERPPRHRREPPGPAARIGLAGPAATARPTSPTAHGGATVLAARALSEGTEHFDAIALVEASERLGASLHADAGWDAMCVSVDVPAPRSSPHSSCSRRWPSTRHSPRRRSIAFAMSVSTTCSRRRPIRAAERTRPSRRRSTQASSPYHRPSGGTRETVAELTAGPPALAPTSEGSIRRAPR